MQDKLENIFKSVETFLKNSEGEPDYWVFPEVGEKFGSIIFLNFSNKFPIWISKLIKVVKPSENPFLIRYF